MSEALSKSYFSVLQPLVPLAAREGKKVSQAQITHYTMGAELL